MGITIHYRGKLKDLDRVEDFEDRILDLALELGGQAHIWRSSSSTDPSRMVRGVRLELCPGQETTSLLISPEGWLINLFEIEDAENGKLVEMPWCFVKTQFGTLEGHVAIVEMFRALKAEFFPDLEVQDEGGYWESGDMRELARKREFLQTAIKALGEGLEQFGLSAEAAEDPEIVIARIARVAQTVQNTLKRPSEHPLVHWDDEDAALEGAGPMSPEEEARWDASFKENRRRQERVGRAIEKHLSEGKSAEDAFDASMHEETALGLPLDESDETGDIDEDASDEDKEGEDWRDSLPEEGAYEDEDWSSEEDDSSEPFGLDRRERHPLLERATELLLRLHELFKGERDSHSSIGTLMQGAMEISGGLAQALSCEDDDAFARGLAVVQLKRSLRGAAFAIGALFPLRANKVIDEAAFKELRAALERVRSEVYDELRRRRAGSAQT